MKKIISTIMMFTLVVGMAMAVPNVAQAEELVESTYVGESELTHDSESTVIVYPRLRGVYLSQGTGTITVPGTGLVGCAGSTAANFSVSSVYIGITLERYVSGSWYTVSSWSQSASNTNYVSIYKVASVTGGYYYRVRTTHYAASDFAMGSTNGVWVAK